MDNIEDRLKNFRTLLERILWKMRLMEEIQTVQNMFFRIPEKNTKAVTKAAVNSTISYFNSIPFLQPLYYASPIEKSGGIMLVSEDEKNIDTVIVTERGYVLTAKDDKKKYMDYYKL